MRKEEIKEKAKEFLFNQSKYGIVKDDGVYIAYECVINIMAKFAESLTEQEQPKQKSKMLKELQNYIKSKSLVELQKEWSELTSHQFDEEQPNQSVEEFIKSKKIHVTMLQCDGGTFVNLSDLLKEYTQTQRTVSDNVKDLFSVDEIIKIINENTVLDGEAFRGYFIKTN